MATHLSVLRIQKGLTQEKFAETMGYTLSRVAMWEIGERKPCIDEVNRMAEFFGVHSEDILFKRNHVKKRNRVPFTKRSVITA